MLSEDLEIHQDSNSQSGSSLGSVKVHSLTLSHTLRSMKCDSWASFLARTLASLCLGHEPKARVAIIQCVCIYIRHFLNLKNCWFSASMVCCVISHHWLFCKGMLECLEKMFVHLLLLLYIIIICFNMQLFFGFDFCVQLVWIIVRTVCDVVSNYEREKMMFASQFFIPRWCQYWCIFEYGQSKNF